MHSGNYGNWLPDANVRLAQLLASMVGPTGKVAIEGFYDDVLPFPPAAVKMMNEVPDDSAGMQQAVRPGLHRRRRVIAAGRVEPPGLQRPHDEGRRSRRRDCRELDR